MERRYSHATVAIVAMSLLSACAGSDVDPEHQQWLTMNARLLTASEVAAPSPELREKFEFVLSRRLVDPDSMQLRDVRARSAGDLAALCGQYNAKNRLGGYAGFKDVYAFFDGDDILKFRTQHKDWKRTADLCRQSAL